MVGKAPDIIADEKIHFKPKFILGMGFFSMFFANQCVPILAIPFYQMTLGVDPFMLGIALTIPMIISSFMGPVVGHMSDRFQSKYGRRRPFIFVASWCSGLTFGLIWMVSPEWSETYQLLYFVVCSIVFYICATFLSVPMTCLAFEMSTDHHERTEVMGFTSYFIRIGSLVYQWLFPLAKLAMFGGVFIGMKYVGWGIGIFIIGLLGCIPALFCKEKNNCKETNYGRAQEYRINSVIEQPSLSKSLKTITRNKSLLVLLILVALQLCGAAFTASMDYYLIVYSLNDGNISEGAIWKGVLSTAYAVIGLVSIPIIAKLSSHYGKAQALKLIYLLTALGGCLKWFVFTPGTYWLLLIDAVFCTAIWTAMTMLIPSMLADICDEDELQYQQRREGLFVSLHAWVTNFSMAGAMLISGLCLNIIGFDAINQGHQSPDSIFYMRVILSGGTVIFSLLPLFLISGYKIDLESSRQTRSKLAQKNRDLSTI